MPQTIRIRSETRAVLEKLAKAEATPMTKMLDKVVDTYRRRKLLEDANADFAALRADPKAWSDELEERKLWERTVGDGLKDD
ncbi:MAG TPA: toxin-antitoxin system protein [Phycisphaerae bacterium]|nr:toxin-antitoxin system protein [Phycisphaerae bacterium]